MPAWSDVQSEVLAAAQGLSPTGTLCIEGSKSETVLECSLLYDQFSYSNPISPEDGPSCNYTYVAVSDDYVDELSPIFTDGLRRLTGSGRR